jgi:hypothetical protein
MTANAKTRKTCNTEGCTRPIGGGPDGGYEDKDWAKQNGYCLPCANEGQMNIAHNNGHESISEEECWYCHPELDQTAQEYTPRNGTARSGMTIQAKGSAKDKALLLQAAIIAAGGTSAKPRTVKGLTTLTGTLADGSKVKVIWDLDRYQYGPSILSNGDKVRKVRNVSEWLRIVG